MMNYMVRVVKGLNLGVFPWHKTWRGLTLCVVGKTHWQWLCRASKVTTSACLPWIWYQCMYPDNWVIKVVIYMFHYFVTVWSVWYYNMFTSYMVSLLISSPSPVFVSSWFVFFFYNGHLYRCELMRKQVMSKECSKGSWLVYRLC